MIKQIVIKGTAIIIGCIAGMILIECTLRLCGPEWLVQRMHELNAGDSLKRCYDNDREWPVVRKGKNVIGFVPNSVFKIVHYEYEDMASIDGLGYRKVYPDQTPNDTRVTIPIVGDSFVFGIGVNDNQTFVSLLAKKLPYIKFINLGIPGSSLENQMDIIEDRHKDLGDPEIYGFVFFTGNDFVLEDKSISALKTSGKVGSIVPRKDVVEWLMRINKWSYHNPVLKRLYSLQYIRNVLFVSYNKIMKARIYDPIFYVMNPTAAPAMGHYLDAQLQRLDEISNRLRFKYFFVIIPDRYQVYPLRLKKKMSYYRLEDADIDILLPNRMLGEKLKEHHVSYLDLMEFFYKKDEGLYYIQDNHLTEKGHKLAYEYIAPFLEKNIAGLMRKNS